MTLWEMGTGVSAKISGYKAGLEDCYHTRLTELGFAGGLSVHRPNGLDINVGIGQESRIRFIDPTTRLETSEFGIAGGIWIDRKGILLASLLVEPHTDRFVGLNVYPGVVPALGNFGFWLNFDHQGRPAFGISHSRTLGVGTGPDQ